MINGDISVYFSSSESVTRQTDHHAVTLGLKYIFANLLLTTKNFDLENQISAFSKSVKARNASLTVYARVTLALQSTDRVSALIESTIPRLRQNPLVECLAIRPATDAQFVELLSQPSHYDLLSVDVSNGSFFQQSFACSKALKSAPQNVVVEVELSQTLRGSTELINLISQSKLVFTKTGKVVVSSGAKSVFEMKSSLDMTNWATNILKLRRPRHTLDRLSDLVAKRRSLIGNYY